MGKMTIELELRMAEADFLLRQLMQGTKQEKKQAEIWAKEHIEKYPKYVVSGDAFLDQ